MKVETVFFWESIWLWNMRYIWQYQLYNFSSKLSKAKPFIDNPIHGVCLFGAWTYNYVVIRMSLISISWTHQLNASVQKYSSKAFMIWCRTFSTWMISMAGGWNTSRSQCKMKYQRTRTIVFIFSICGKSDIHWSAPFKWMCILSAVFKHPVIFCIV